MRLPIKAYHDHKASAARRGIPFLLTFSEWKEIWNASGRFDQRGRFKGQYCMARFGDCGAYERGNVKIITMEANRSEQKLSDDTREKMRAAKLGGKLSPEHRAKIAAAHCGRIDTPETRKRKRLSKIGSKNPMFGRRATEATRAKLREAHQRRKQVWLRSQFQADAR